MNTKNPDTMRKIIDFIEEYSLEYNTSPTIRVIASNVGIGKTTAHRYLVHMNKNGMLSYDGKTITTDKIARDRTIRVPIVGNIACGIPNIAEQEIEEYVTLPESIFGQGDFYILKTRGESMIEAGIDEGDLVVVRQQETARNGNIVVALTENEATLKRFYKEDGYVILHPENSSMEDIIVSDCNIQGVAVKVIKDLI